MSHPMMQYLIIALLCLSCLPSQKQDNEHDWTKPNLEGHWKLYDTEIVDEVPFLGLQAPERDPLAMVHEDSPWDHYVENDLVFENDTMYRINYPVKCSKPIPYYLDTGYIHLGSKDTINSYPVELVGDTLYLYQPVWTDPGFFKETYVRTSFNDSTLDVMKKYRINYPELAGTWYLVRAMDYDYGTYYELQFPYNLPDSIELSPKQMIHALDNEKAIMILTDGIKREYSFFYYNQHIHVEPGDWYQGNKSMIFFSRNY